MTFGVEQYVVGCTLELVYHSMVEYSLECWKSGVPVFSDCYNFTILLLLFKWFSELLVWE